MRFSVPIAAALACLGAWTPARAQTSLESAAQALSEGKAKLVFEAGKKPAAPAGQPTQAAPVEKKDAPSDPKADVERFKAIMKKVDAGEAIPKADKEWAVGKLKEELKRIDSGEAENAIVKSLEKKVDQAIKDGKIPAEAKPEVMKQLREQVHAQLDEIAQLERETLKKLENAKTQ